MDDGQPEVQTIPRLIQDWIRNIGDMLMPAKLLKWTEGNTADQGVAQRAREPIVRGVDEIQSFHGPH